MVLEPDTGQCASKDGGPQRGVDCEIPHRLERERVSSRTLGHPPKGVDCKIPHQLERETSASKDAGPGVVVGSHIDWRESVTTEDCP